MGYFEDTISAWGSSEEKEIWEANQKTPQEKQEELARAKMFKKPRVKSKTFKNFRKFARYKP